MTVEVNVLRPNLTQVEVGEVILYFSYKTLVAFRHPKVDGGRSVVCENVWSTTTGRHLNELDLGAKEDRISRENFLALVEKHIEPIGKKK